MTHPALLQLADDGHAAGGWGFLIVLGLIIASVLLFIAMRSSLSKVPETFDHQPGDEDRPPPAAQP
ncbi:MAG TPA: hypothetical protein VHE83_16440 [Mycobacteriales bacterium]|nr:hypothetical protein [Mycobacteriales bacterium]